MTKIEFTKHPETHETDAEWSHAMGHGQYLIIQDARPYGGNLCVNVWDENSGTMFYFGEYKTLSSAKTRAGKVLDLVTKHGVEKASSVFTS